MAKLIYLAYPIDHVDDEDQAHLRSSVSFIKEWLAGLNDYLVFDPGGAWLALDCKPDERLQLLNTAVLTQADLVFAVFPAELQSVGVPMEVGLASYKGIPSVVIRDGESWALTSSNIHQFDTADTAAALIQAVEILEAAAPKKSPVPVAQFVLDKSFPDVDPGPRQGYSDDAGFDLVCYLEKPVTLRPGESANIPAGCAIEWPPNVWGLILGRSSTFHKRGLLVNPGVIDPGYRGDLFNNVRNISHEEHTVHPGDRIAQIIPLPALAPRINLVETDKLSETERGTSGFGSSGQ